jgi:lysophospholipase L1-like esterase
LSLALKLVLSPLLIAQAMATRRRAPVLPEAGGLREGRLGGRGPALRVLIAGDSSAAGVGVAHQDQSVAGYFTRTLQPLVGRPLHWTLRARSGLTTKQVHELLRADRPAAVDIAVVITGVNDVIDQLPSQRAVLHRAALADWLLAERLAAHVVFAPLPPIHQFPLLPQPLRRVMGDDARRHNEALAAWAQTRVDVSCVPIPLTLSPDTMASDGFHPGEPVYRVCGEALAGFVADQLIRMETTT